MLAGYNSSMATATTPSSCCVQSLPPAMVPPPSSSHGSSTVAAVVLHVPVLPTKCSLQWCSNGQVRRSSIGKAPGLGLFQQGTLAPWLHPGTCFPTCLLADIAAGCQAGMGSGNQAMPADVYLRYLVGRHHANRA
mmetsp:Transcript_38110/g.96363  ORF Transcript_38110/g.96363 Transcript_38110/m.96363 type:complete len:135 (-) Transcript_38110:136-540(-)